MGVVESENAEQTEFGVKSGIEDDGGESKLEGQIKEIVEKFTNNLETDLKQKLQE